MERPDSSDREVLERFVKVPATIEIRLKHTDDADFIPTLVTKTKKKVDICVIIPENLMSIAKAFNKGRTAIEIFIDGAKTALDIQHKEQ